MSQLEKWQFREFFQNDREKIIQILTSEIIFLNHCLNQVNKRKEINGIKRAKNKLEKLLNAQLKQITFNISEKDYENIILTIFKTLNKVVNKLA